MAATIGTSKATCHIRSISLPTRSHPVTASLEEQLCRLRTSPTIGTSKATCHIRSISLPTRSHPVTASLEEQLCRLRTSPSSVFHQLGGLKELNECIAGFLQLSHTQQALSHDLHCESVEEVLNGSLRVLDLCGTTRDVFSQMKECLQELQSSLRRRKGCESSFKNEIGEYMACRKKLNKVINNCFKNLKRCKSDKDTETVDAIRTLKQVEEISVVVLLSILSYISQPKARSNWSMVSKLLKSKHISCDGDNDANEVQKMEAELLAMKSRKDTNLVPQVLKELEAIELSIQEIEDELECVFRQSVKTRASLLNILNH